MSDILHRRPSHRHQSGGARLHDPDPGHDWRCRCCGGLLGRVRSNRLHIRMKGCSEYFAALPCTATCRTCGGLNEVARD